MLLHYWWGCQRSQTFWKLFCGSSTVKHRYSPEISLLGVYSEVKTCVHTKTCSLMFISGLPKWNVSCSVTSDSLRPHGLWPTRLLYPWDSQARILEWVAMPFSRGFSQSRDRTQVSCIAGEFFITEPPGEAQVNLRQVFNHICHTSKIQKLKPILIFWLESLQDSQCYYTYM